VFTSAYMFENTLGWDQVSRWEPLLADFISLAQQLEKLGFTYSGGKVIVLRMEDAKNV
jgi:hypothetical protein